MGTDMTIIIISKRLLMNEFHSLLPERTPELRIPELVERIPVEAFAVEDPVALELILLEPSEII